MDLQKLLEKINQVKVAVYGDFCLDAYWIMDTNGSEISVETGQQANAIKQHYYSPGGAGNVVMNLAALQPASIEAIGVVGDDLYGRELKSLLVKHHVAIDSLFVQPEYFDTYTYVKQILGGKEIARHDFGLSNHRNVQTDNQVLLAIDEALDKNDVFIFNQQVQGSLSEEFMKNVNLLFEKHSDKFILVDSRHHNAQFQNTSFKLNEIEAARLCGKSIDYQDYVATADISKYARQLFDKSRKALFITCGERGILAIDQVGIHHATALQLVSKIDTVGAGDTTLSAIALCLAAKASTSETIRFANFAAAVSVQKLFTTGTASPEEIIELSLNANFIYRPELSENSKPAKYWNNSKIELCDKSVLTRLGGIQHVVFDHDGTISSLRAGWEKIMLPMMLEAILGKEKESADLQLLDYLSQRCQDFINRTTGIQTIVQMEGLVQMIREFGLVPDSQILEKQGYKKIYNNALLEMVNQRLQKIEKFELNANDFIINGAVDFLKALKAKGISLYLASGTDHEDVINEATLLGYADLFEGRIYGAVGDIKKYSKRMVIEKIIKDHNLNNNQLLVIGDGPVEIRECRRFEGITIGIASEENHREIVNLEKRKRLIQSGAHFIIPDFLEYPLLMELLKI